MEELPYKQEDIDIEVRDLVNALNIGGIPTVSCCSGHGREHGHISLKDGRVLVIFTPDAAKDEEAIKDDVVNMLRRHTMTKMPELSDRAIGKILKRWCGPAVNLVPFSRAIAKAQRELLKGWIPLPSDERMADITATAGGLPSPEWKTILKMLQEGDEEDKT